MSKVHRLTIQNLKNIEEIDFQVPDGPVIYVTGPNAAGKTTVLDSILYALAGKKVIPDGVIRAGADKSEIRVELDDGAVIERSITEKGAYLKYTVEGRDVPSPQAALDALVGPVSMDPWKFCQMKPADQFTAIVRAEGLEDRLAAVEAEHAESYDSRRLVGREIKRLEAAFAMTEKPPADLPEQEHTDIQGLRAGLMAMRDQRARRFAAAERVRELREQLEAAEATLAEIEPTSDAELERIDGEIARRETENALINKAAIYRQKEGELRAARDEHATHDRRLAEIARDKLDLLAGIDLGVPGMEIREDGALVLEGVPFELLNTAQKLKLACAFATKGDPALKIVRVTDASLLDKGSQAFLSEMATEKGYQVWVEMVRETGEAGLVLSEDLA